MTEFRKGKMDLNQPTSILEKYRTLHRDNRSKALAGTILPQMGWNALFFIYTLQPLNILTCDVRIGACDRLYRKRAANPRTRSIETETVCSYRRPGPV